jgi:dTMP kinase
MSCGFFVTFEGLDGSGKSTQLRKLAQWLAANGRKVTKLRQPGGTRAGDRIRSLLLDSRTKGLAPRTELGLMFSDRAQAIAEIIRPALDRGAVVLCDRYTDSTEAYQGGGRQLGSELVLQLHAALCQNLQPDLTLLLLPDFERSLERARKRNARSKGKDENRFEREDKLFYRRVYDKYREIARRESSRVATFEGDGGIEEIHQRIVETVKSRIHELDQ